MIIYYSGTGNSLTVAQGLAKALNDKALSISEAKKLTTIDDEVVGFVYPVHSYDMPQLVKRTVQKLALPKVKYTFAVLTHGGNKGNAILSAKLLLQEKGTDLNYHNDILMPVNSRIMYGMLTDKIEERTSLAKRKIDVIANDILYKTQNAQKVKKQHFTAFIKNILESNWARNYFTPQVKANLCTNCGICQRVCPASNITVKNDKAFIENNCEQCTTCMHWCPEVAIHYKKRNIRKKQQYHHPDVKLKDIQI